MQHATNATQMPPWYPLAFDDDLSFLWGKAKGIGFFAKHERTPTNEEMHDAIVDVSRVMGWTFDESTFATFARAMAEHANVDECRKAQASLDWLMSENDDEQRGEPWTAPI
jgi:hypothetical protein